MNFAHANRPGVNMAATPTEVNLTPRFQLLLWFVPPVLFSGDGSAQRNTP
jgi:hypothetical protein